MKSDAGGGQKINILRENLAPYKEEKDKLILFTDSYDVIFTQSPDFLLKKFETFRPARIVFGAEDFCWPDKNLQVRFFRLEIVLRSGSSVLQYDYPFVGSNEKRFLNSGGFIGYASDVYEMIMSQGDVKDDDDDQLFYTKIFLNETTRVSAGNVERRIRCSFFIGRKNGRSCSINVQIFF